MVKNKILNFCKKHYCQIIWSTIAIFLIFILALWIFSLFEPIGKETKIKEFTTSVHLIEQSNFQQNFSTIKIESVELILSKILERYKYNKICFKDEGSYISEDAFSGSPLLFDVSHNGQNQKLEKNIIKCFNLGKESNLEWNFTPSSTDEMTQSFFAVKEFRSEIEVQPNISTYLKKNLSYNLYLFLFCLFYSGIFFWAITRIIQFIIKPIKK